MPPFATITGSTMIGTRRARTSSVEATAEMISSENSMPVLTASAPISASTTDICSATNSGSIGSTQNTPKVF